MAANDRARERLREGDGLLDEGGLLRAAAPEDDARLQRLLARALPRFGAPAEGGSMTVARDSGPAPLAVHVSAVAAGPADAPARRVAALVLVVDPRARSRIDPALAAAVLRLTPAESEVAVMLAAGHAPRAIAAAIGRRESTVRWHLKQIFQKQGISRQAELVRRVLSLGGLPAARRRRS